jgi:hypothetical protein
MPVRRYGMTERKSLSRRGGTRLEVMHACESHVSTPPLHAGMRRDSGSDEQVSGEGKVTAEESERRDAKT